MLSQVHESISDSRFLRTMMLEYYAFQGLPLLHPLRSAIVELQIGAKARKCRRRDMWIVVNDYDDRPSCLPIEH